MKLQCQNHSKSQNLTEWWYWVSWSIWTFLIVSHTIEKDNRQGRHIRLCWCSSWLNDVLQSRQSLDSCFVRFLSNTDVIMIAETPNFVALHFNKLYRSSLHFSILTSTARPFSLLTYGQVLDAFWAHWDFYICFFQIFIQVSIRGT